MNVHKDMMGPINSAPAVASLAETVEPDLARLLNILNRRRNVILGTVALVTSIVLLVMFQLNPQYTSNETILLEPR